jgi:hypothetical protein
MIFAGDVIIKAAIEQGLEDMRKNVWLLDDVLSQFVKEESLKNKYGQKEIDAAKEWFLNNNISVYLQHRIDKDQLPAVIIGLGYSNELDEMKHMGDLSTEVETLMPSQIGKPIPYVVKPFTPTSYDDSEGTVGFPKELNIQPIAPGMILVDPDTGNGYEIKAILPGRKIQIEPNLDLDSTRLAVVPKYQFYRVRREHSFFAESYTIGCHVHGDVAPLLWLHAIVAYILLRYRESLLEGRCFSQSKISSSDLMPNQDMNVPGGENVYSRYITLTGQVENSWLKTPKRVIESAILENEPDKEEGFKGGIKIISQQAPDFLDSEEEPWTTIDE